MLKRNEWFEVFRVDEFSNSKTIFSNENLEECVKVYRKEKIKDKSIRIDKWLHDPNFGILMPIKSILN